MITSDAPTVSVALDIAPPQQWRRWIPTWLRALIWVDSVAHYDAFLSYSWTSDMKVAPFVQLTIARFLCPWYKIRAKTVFRDLSCLPAGSSLDAELYSRLDQSSHFIVMASPEAKHSVGMEREAQHWLSRHRTGELLVIVTAGSHSDQPVIADLEHPQDERSYRHEKIHDWQEIRDRLLPPSLQHHFAATQTTPVWMSINQHRTQILNNPRSRPLRGRVIEDLKQLFLRLYSGKSWELLRGEESVQQRRALGLVGGVAGLFFLAMITIIGEVQSAQRSAADAQASYRVALEAATNISKFARDQMAPDGKQQPMSIVARRLLSIPTTAFGSLNPRYEPSDAALARDDLFENLWNNFYILNDLRAGDDAAATELAIAAQHVSGSRNDNGSPDRNDWLHYLVRAKENLGDDARNRGDLAASRGFFHEAMDIAGSMSRKPGGR